MKKNILIIIFATILVILVVGGLLLYFSNQDGQKQTNSQQVSQKDTRELIWEKLPSEQKERVNGTWVDGKLSKITLDKNAIGWIDDKSYEGKEVYLVDFPTKNTGIPNNMLIYADIDTFEYIGNAPVD